MPQEDDVFYTYVYVDTRRPGNFSYKILGETLTFSYEPIYVGKGKVAQLARREKELGL